MHIRRAEGGFPLLVQELRMRTFQRVEFVFSTSVEGGGKLFQRPFVETVALATVIFRFEMENRRLCLLLQ